MFGFQNQAHGQNSALGSLGFFGHVRRLEKVSARRSGWFAPATAAEGLPGAQGILSFMPTF